MKTNFKGTGGKKAGDGQFLNSTINEDDCEHDENDAHVSACFGNDSNMKQQSQEGGARPTFGKAAVNEEDHPKLEIIEEEESNMVDEFLRESNRHLNETRNHKTEELKVTSKSSIKMDADDSVSAENVLLQSDRSASSS